MQVPTVYTDVFGPKMPTAAAPSVRGPKSAHLTILSRQVASDGAELRLLFSAEFGLLGCVRRQNQVTWIEARDIRNGIRPHEDGQVILQRWQREGGLPCGWMLVFHRTRLLVFAPLDGAANPNERRILLYPDDFIRMGSRSDARTSYRRNLIRFTGGEDFSSHDAHHAALKSMESLIQNQFGISCHAPELVAWVEKTKHAALTREHLNAFRLWMTDNPEATPQQLFAFLSQQAELHGYQIGSFPDASDLGTLRMARNFEPTGAARKTVLARRQNVADLIDAFGTLGIEEISTPLQVKLSKPRATKPRGKCLTSKDQVPAMSLAIQQGSEEFIRGSSPSDVGITPPCAGSLVIAARPQGRVDSPTARRR